jgi:NADH-quinone oxidoreductase subunit M
LAVVAAAALNGVAVLHAYFQIFTGKRYFPSISLQARPPERIAVTALATLILGGGVFPQPGLSSRYHAASKLIEARLQHMGQATTLEAHGESDWPEWFNEEEKTDAERETVDPALEIDAQSEPKGAGATPLPGGPSAEHTPRRLPNT